MDLPRISRRPTRQVRVGELTLGGSAPIRIQSMTNTPTSDVDATMAQVSRLARAGCDLVRVAVPTAADAAALGEIVRQSPVPIIADVHYSAQLALAAVAAGAHKIRLNPGNLTDPRRVRQIIAACRERHVPIRVGVNEGSIVQRAQGDQRRREQATPLVDLMATKLAEYVAIFEAEHFEDLVLAAKSADAVTCIAVNRLLAQRWDYPLHLGVTHAGDVHTGAVRSAAALGALLANGIGDTLRISLTGDPLEEVLLAKELLCSLHLRPRDEAEIISCPTCGRVSVDLAALVREVRQALTGVGAGLKVAVMGCVVNGPGEAEGAHVAACAGATKATIYVDGRPVETVPNDRIAEALVERVRRYEAGLSG
jgi:(E)-4-hydroxy-3-methylbut-2-enyl-diphosphate synthase